METTSEVKLKNGYFIKGEPLGITDKYGTLLHSGDLVAAIHGNIRNHADSFSVYHLIGTRKVGEERRALIKTTNNYNVDYEVSLRQEWCIFVKSYLDE
jgi:hypothetical protein